MAKQIRRSNAKTAWALCEAVIRAIRREPKRADMGEVVSLCGVGDPDEGVLAADRTPACGTVGCFAGWVDILALGRRRAYDIQNQLTFARYLLGKEQGVNFKLLCTEPQSIGDPLCFFDVFNGGLGDGIITIDKGTVEYVEAVVTRIRRFMQLNEAKLKARKITPRTVADSIRKAEAL